MKFRGYISTVYTVHCGGCEASIESGTSAQPKGIFGDALRKIGWESTRAFGWLCPTCAKDTISVIMGQGSTG